MTQAEITKIELPLLDYSKRRDSNLKECYLLLYSQYITYKIVGTYEVLNEDTELWESKIANYRWCRNRKDLSEVSMYFDNKESLYSVGVEFNGVAEGNSWLFKTGKEALVLYDTLVQYMVESVPAVTHVMTTGT